jgi:hypothetical protein
MAVLALRGIPMAITNPLLVSIIHPRLTGAVRATYLSVQSFAGRLAFSATLLLASLVVEDVATLDWEELSGIVSSYLIATVIILPLMVYGAVRVTRETQLSPGDGCREE